MVLPNSVTLLASSNGNYILYLAESQLQQLRQAGVSNEVIDEAFEEAASCLANSIGESAPVHDYRISVTTLVAAMFVVFLWFRTRDVKNGPRAKAFGALTYPLYLLHAEIGYTILSLAQTEANKWLVTPSVLLLSAALAWLVAVQIENRYKAVWKLLADRVFNRPIAKILASSLR